MPHAKHLADLTPRRVRTDNDQSFDDFELHRPPAGTCLDLKRLTPEAVPDGSPQDCPILPSPGQGRVRSRNQTYPMKTTPPFDLVIGLDRSDRKADLHLLHLHSGAEQRQTIPTSPEALQSWARGRAHRASR